MRLLAFALILSLSQTAWAEEQSERYEFPQIICSGSIQVQMGPGVVLKSYGYNEETGLFQYLAVIDEKLIEQEKLRRGK